DAQGDRSDAPPGRARAQPPEGADHQPPAAERPRPRAHVRSRPRNRRRDRNKRLAGPARPFPAPDPARAPGRGCAPPRAPRPPPTRGEGSGTGASPPPPHAAAGRPPRTWSTPARSQRSSARTEVGAAPRAHGPTVQLDRAADVVVAKETAHPHPVRRRRAEL